MNAEVILDEICCDDPYRASQALQLAGSQRETLTEPLLARLAATVAQPKAASDADGSSPLFLFYLAAAWRETRAYPALISLLRLPENEVESLLGDFVSEDAGIILADTFSGEIALLHALIFDREAYGFARGAGLTALSILAHRGSYPRATLLDDFSALAATFDPESDSDQITACTLVSCLLDLHAWELRGLALQLYDRGLVDDTFIGYTEVEDALVPSRAFHAPPKALTGSITDAWQAVSDWDFFSPLRPSRKRPSATTRTLPISTGDTEDVGSVPDFDAPLPKPLVSTPKPGRNEPCSCGSGKKYKKCCGA